MLLEFMGLANHRKEIRAEIAAWSERWREMQITALNFIVREHGIDTDEFPPAAVAVVIASIGRTLDIGAGTGHLGRSRRGRRAGQPIPGPIRDADPEDSPGAVRRTDLILRAARTATAPSRDGGRRRQFCCVVVDVPFGPAVEQSRPARRDPPGVPGWLRGSSAGPSRRSGARCCAMDVERVRIGVAAMIAISGAKQQQHRAAGRNGGVVALEIGSHPSRDMGPSGLES